MKAFKAEDFLKALSEGQLVEDQRLALTGYAKAGPDDRTLAFSPQATDGEGWLPIPVNTIDTVEWLGKGGCEQKRIDRVRLVMKPPTSPEALLYASLARKALTDAAGALHQIVHNPPFAAALNPQLERRRPGGVGINSTSRRIMMYATKQNPDVMFDNQAYVIEAGARVVSACDCDGFFLPSDVTCETNSADPRYRVMHGPIACKYVNGDVFTVTNGTRSGIDLFCDTPPQSIYRPDQSGGGFGQINWFIPNEPQSKVNEWAGVFDRLSGC